MSLRQTEKPMIPDTLSNNHPNLSSEQIQTQHSIHSNHPRHSLKLVTPNLRLHELIRIKNEPTSARKIQMKGNSPRAPRGSRHFMCLICMNQKLCHEELFLCDCEHKHDYCEDCMNQYTLYRINQFQEVTCPNPACDIPIDTSLAFFQQLPTRIQDRYYHIHQFHVTHQDDNMKLCPADSCDGVIQKNVSQDRTMLCNTCKRIFCSECLLEQHQGDCDEHQVKFLEQNLNYKKCQCGIIIEKQEGCNHVTCICGHDFCYLCGEPWTNDHDRPHDAHNKVHTEQRRRKHEDNPSYKQPQRTDSDAQFYLMTVLTTFLRILLFPFKIVIIILLVLVLVVYSLLMLMVAIFFCVCIVCSQDCYEIFSRVGRLGGEIVGKIAEIWEY